MNFFTKKINFILFVIIFLFFNTSINARDVSQKYSKKDISNCFTGVIYMNQADNDYPRFFRIYAISQNMTKNARKKNKTGTICYRKILTIRFCSPFLINRSKCLLIKTTTVKTRDRGLCYS